MLDSISSAEITEYLRDYLTRHDLPTSFDNIQIGDKTFKDLFIAKFNLYEIGFETEEEFEQKLEMQAAIVLAKYEPLLAKFNSVLADFNKTIKNSKGWQYNKSNFNQKQFDNNLSSVVEDTDVNSQVDSENVNDNKGENEEATTTTNIDDYLKAVKELDAIGFNMLNEFKPLFIQIFYNISDSAFSFNEVIKCKFIHLMAWS